MYCHYKSILCRCLYEGISRFNIHEPGGNWAIPGRCLIGSWNALNVDRTNIWFAPIDLNSMNRRMSLRFFSLDSSFKYFEHAVTSLYSCNFVITSCFWFIMLNYMSFEIFYEEQLAKLGVCAEVFDGVLCEENNIYSNFSVIISVSLYSNTIFSIYCANIEMLYVEMFRLRSSST